MTILSRIRKQLAERKIIDVLHFVWDSTRKWTVISVVLVIIDSVFPVLILYSTKLVLDTVTTGLESGEDPELIFNRVLTFIIFLGAVTLLSVLNRSIMDFAYDSLSKHVTDHTYKILHSKAITVDLESYEAPEYYDTLHRAQEEASYRPAEVVRGLLRLAKNGLSLLGVMILLISFHPAVAIILIAAGIPGVVARFWHSKKLYNWHRKQAPIKRRADYLNDIITGQDHAKENQLFGLGKLFSEQSVVLRDKLRTEQLKLYSQLYTSEFFAQALTTIIVFGLFAMIAQRTLEGAISIGDLVMYYQAFQQGQGFLRSFLGGIAELYENSLFLSNLYEFLELETTINDPAKPKEFPKAIQQGIVFHDVGFAYPSSTRNAIENVNLRINPGEVIAIVGENGSGKTTLIKLLCRLYDPTCGSITVDGIPLTDFKVADLRNHITVVFQDYIRYHLSVRENIWLGRIDLPLESDKVIESAKYSGADAVISKLDKGYDTILGKRLEEGEELSIGEWQKLALSRAYLRDSQIIILDEPTSALDANSEQEVFNQFRELAKGKLAVLISHRLSTIKMADRIYYVNDGLIVESGSHDDLIAKQGVYASMFEMQAKNYR